jgi:hypothetical protein
MVSEMNFLAFSAASRDPSLFLQLILFVMRYFRMPNDFNLAILPDIQQLKERQ